MLQADAVVKPAPSAHSRPAPGPPSPGTAFREGDVATTHFFLSKWLGNNANTRQICPVSGKRKWANTKPIHASYVCLCSPCNSHWQCLAMCVPQNTQHGIGKTVAKFHMYN